MNEYVYKARDVEGELVQGTIEAENEQSASNLLSSKKLILVDIANSTRESRGIPFLNRVKVKDKVFFVRQLATMTKAGLPIAQSLATLNEQTSSKPVKKMIEQVMRDIEGGDNLSTAFSKSKVFDPTDVSMITAGEASGKLDNVLETMAIQSEKSYKAMKKIRNTFIYPAFLLVVIVGIVVVMMVFVLPQMEGLYKSFGNAQLPLPTRILIGLSHFLTGFWWLVIALVIALVVGFKAYIKTDVGKYMWHGIKLKIPLFGAFLQMSYISIFTRTMSSLVSSGVPILDTLRIVGDTMPNVIYKDAVNEVQEKVKQGQNVSTALRENKLFPIMLPQMVGVGESTGELDKMLGNLAEYYSDEMDNWVKGFQSLLEPIMIVFMGGIVGSIVLSIILPVYNLANVIK